MTRDTANIEYCTRPACLKATGCTGICSRENAPLAALAPAPAPDDEALMDAALEAMALYVRSPQEDDPQTLAYLARKKEDLRRRIAELRAELARWQSGELCTAKDAANNLHNLEVLGCANRRAEIAEARVAELEAAQIPTPPEGMHYELVRDGTTPRQRANHKRHARHIAILMNKGPK